MTAIADPDGFDLVGLLRENERLKAEVADITAEADHLRAVLERMLALRRGATDADPAT